MTRGLVPRGDEANFGRLAAPAPGLPMPPPLFDALSGYGSYRDSAGSISTTGASPAGPQEALSSSPSASWLLSSSCTRLPSGGECRHVSPNARATGGKQDRAHGDNNEEKYTEQDWSSRCRPESLKKRTSSSISSSKPASPPSTLLAEALKLRRSSFMLRGPVAAPLVRATPLLPLFPPTTPRLLARPLPVRRERRSPQ